MFFQQFVYSFWESYNTSPVGSFPPPFAAHTSSFPILLPGGAKFSSLHIPGKKIASWDREAWKGFLNKCASRVDRALEEAESLLWFSAIISSQRMKAVKEMDDSSPCLTSVWKLKKISLRQWTLSEDLAFSLFPSSNQLPISFTLIHLSYFLSPSLSSISSALFYSSWFYMVIGGLDVESVPGCSPVWSGLWRPAIVTTLWGQEIHWLIRCYFRIPCFSDCNHTLETYLDWSLSMTHKSPQNDLNTG